MKRYLVYLRFRFCSFIRLFFSLLLFGVFASRTKTMTKCCKTMLHTENLNNDYRLLNCLVNKLDSSTRMIWMDRMLPKYNSVVVCVSMCRCGWTAPEPANQHHQQHQHSSAAEAAEDFRGGERVFVYDCMRVCVSMLVNLSTNTQFSDVLFGTS